VTKESGPRFLVGWRRRLRFGSSGEKDRRSIDAGQ
jgi:hypothetical protein